MKTFKKPIIPVVPKEKINGLEIRTDKAIILKKNGRTMANPNDYKAYNWYVGKILIDGELLL